VLPDQRAAGFQLRVAVFAVVALAIRNHLGPPDISSISARIEALLDETIQGITISAPVRVDGDIEGLADLSAINFEKLAKAFTRAPRTTVEAIRAKATETVQAMVAANPTRADLIAKLEKLIDAYNAATVNVEEQFEALKRFLAELDEEEGRAAREGLTKEEGAIFDLLTKPEPKLTKVQELQVKKIARDLLAKLTDKVSVFQWRQRQATRADVRWTIEQVLNRLPEEPYSKDIWDEKVEQTWSFIFNHSGDSGNTHPSLSHH
jgi:type I restriction enzyme R subunit